MRDLLNWLRAHPCAVLLAIQVLGLIIYPFLGAATVGRALFGLFGIAALAVAVLAVRSTPSTTWVSVLLGGPVLVLTVIEAVVPGNYAVLVTSAVLHCAFYGYTAVALIRYMFNDDTVTTDELFATGATFTVVAWGFAYLFQATQAIWPHSFIAAVDADQPRTWVELLFLSVTTLTSTGLSDILPIGAHARSVVMIEQIAGMLYLALVVARVTALMAGRTVRREKARDHDE